MANYAAHYNEFRAAGAGLAALSVDDQERSSALVRDLNLPFPILCDPRREVVQAFGLLNSAEKGGIAYPAVFLIDRTGIVRWRTLENVAGRAKVKDMVALARAMSEYRDSGSAPRSARIWPGLMYLRALRNALRRGVRQE